MDKFHNRWLKEANTKEYIPNDLFMWSQKQAEFIYNDRNQNSGYLLGVDID